MRCPKCNLQLRVKSSSVSENIRTLRFSCENPNCRNYKQIVKEMAVEEIQEDFPTIERDN